MAKSRFLHDALQTDSRPSGSSSSGALPLLLPSLTLCFLCSTLPSRAQSTQAASSTHGAAISEISTSGALNEVNELPPAPIFSSHAEARKAALEKTSKQAVEKFPAAKISSASKPKFQTTALRTSSASRMVMRRSGALRRMTAEKNTPRFALTTPGDSIKSASIIGNPTIGDVTNAETTASTQPAAFEASTSPVAVELTSAAPKRVQIAAREDEAVPVTATIPLRSSTTTAPVSTSQTVSLQTNTAPVASTADVNLTSSADANDQAIEALPDGAVSAIIGARAASTRPGTKQPARLYAPRISYDRGVIIAHGDADNPVRLESSDARIIADEVRLDTATKTVKAAGKVRVERQITVSRYTAFRPLNIKGSPREKETITETLQGENFEYNFGTKQGSLDKTRVRLQNFNITAEHLIINGDRTIARNVVIRPGGLSDEEIRIYGTPPFNLRAREVIVDRSKLAPTATKSADTRDSDSPSTAPPGPRTEVHGAALYFKNLRLIPVPAALLSRGGGPREESTYQITPRIYTNSSDGVLVTARLQFPLTKPATDASAGKTKSDLMLTADVGLSTKVGFRGGVDLDSHSRFGTLKIGARINDVVSSQLTDRIELDRLPEIQYRPPNLPLFALPGGRRAGLRFSFVAGSYRENFTSQDRSVNDSRLQGQVTFTTRLNRGDGPYLDLFARGARYGDFEQNLTSLGFEAGYIGHLGSRINGQFSYSAQNVKGATPFRFDRVEIRKEIRTTFDILLTPRYIIPIDLRYDVDRHTLRDKTFGLLRNYKTFAYGVVYQSSRHELRFEIRQGF